MLMVASLALWATFGRLDIVVQAQGKLVPASLIKIVQPSENGRVTEVLVHDGQHVQAQQLLARLDTASAVQDLAALQTQHSLLAARAAALAAALDGRSLHTDEPVVDAEFASRQTAWRQAQATAKAELARAAAELLADEHNLAKQSALFELATRAESAHQHLRDRGFVSEFAFQAQQKERIESERDLRSTIQSAQARRAAVKSAQSRLDQVTTDLRAQLSQEHTRTRIELERTRAELEKAQYRLTLAEMRAPVAGTINALAVRTPGQVVAAGATLMTLVPNDDTLLAEVWVRNQDAGFVYPGMPVRVKLVTFPFQKYGWLDGTLQWAGADAEVPEGFRNASGEPLFFKARVALASQHLVRNGHRFEARAGMQVVADMLLGERTLLEYLTSPVQKAVLEAARER